MRIQIRRPAGHGDVLSLTAVIPGLQKKYPGVTISFMVSESFEQLILHDPRIEEIVLWGNAFDWDADDPIMRVAHANCWDKYTWMCFAQCDVLDVERNFPKLYLLPEEIDVAQGCDVVMANRYPHGGRSYKYMAGLAALLVDKGYQVKQIDTCPLFCQGVDNAPLTIREAAAEVAKARCLITVDSVFLHVGAALEKPMVVIFNREQRSGPESQYVPNSWIAGWQWNPKRIVPMVEHLLGDGPAPDEENTFDPAYKTSQS